ncbi:hypothetical protein [Psychromonas hadalis]|uniref:hypothetical protein n=1 Tax=Psychromonas hadalis TaxID=211669 RepID=UPI0003B519C0|nr:hypothetical protein [Psychromonas hadalis]
MILHNIETLSGITNKMANKGGKVQQYFYIKNQRTTHFLVFFLHCYNPIKVATAEKLNR